MSKLIGSSFGITCIKWTVFIFNLIFFLTGCGLIGLGVWLNVARNDWEGISDYSYITVANIAIGTGAIIVFLSFLGCCGAITENKIMLLVFFVFLVVIFILEVTGGVSTYVWRKEIDDELLTQLEKRIPDRYYVEDGVKTAMNSVQEYFKCCGLHSSTDWSKQVKDMKRYVDESCCIQETDHVDYNANCQTVSYENIVTNPNILKYYYSKGCYQSIKDFMEENLWVLGVIGLVFAGFQIVGMASSMLLYCTIRRSNLFI